MFVFFLEWRLEFGLPNDLRLLLMSPWGRYTLFLHFIFVYFFLCVIISFYMYWHTISFIMPCMYLRQCLINLNCLHLILLTCWTRLQKSFRLHAEEDISWNVCTFALSMNKDNKWKLQNIWKLLSWEQMVCFYFVATVQPPLVTSICSRMSSRGKVYFKWLL